jgi:uncharacterized membrane protein YdjX (TVP38/TMEM64 family)
MCLTDFDAELVRRQVETAGGWGVLFYVVTFVIGELVHIPGMVFVAAAILAYGRYAGFFVGLLGAVCAVVVSFLFVRAVGGKLLTEIDHPFVKRMMARLDERPVTTVLVLRSFLWLAPPLNYALAMSSIGFGDYLVGSTLGLVVPVLAAGFLFEWLFS